MARIAVGGFQHETNTFSPIPASFADFEAPDAWPGLTRGQVMLEAVAGINLPAAGFVGEARSLHHDLVPLTWCSAQPSGKVTRDAYERVSALLLEDLRAHGAIDAVYLDLHGAMVAELTPIRERAAALQAEPARVLEALGDGAARAREVARETVREVRAIMGLDPLSAAAASLPAPGDAASG
jgi:hypothetical protein